MHTWKLLIINRKRLIKFSYKSNKLIFLHPQIGRVQIRSTTTNFPCYQHKFRPRAKLPSWEQQAYPKLSLSKLSFSLISRNSSPHKYVEHFISKIIIIYKVLDNAKILFLLTRLVLNYLSKQRNTVVCCRVVLQP